MKIPNMDSIDSAVSVSLARIVSEDSQLFKCFVEFMDKSSKDS